MNPKTLVTLGALAVVASGASILVLSSDRPAAESSAASGASLLPELRARVNDVARIALLGGGEALVLEREGETWGLADKGGYPVDVNRVKALVVGLSELKLVEEKTANPEWFARLDLQDPGGADVPSRGVRLEDAAGAVLADLVVGRSNPGRGPAQSTLFVRKTGGGPALEVRGSLNVDSRPTNWLDRQIAKVERKRVREVTVTHPDGEVLSVGRDSPDVNDFQVRDLPEGAELSWAGVAGGVAGALEYLNLEDVRPAAEVELDPARAVTTRFTTFDGLVVTARTLEQDDGKVLLAVEAAFDEGARAQEPVGPPEPPAEGEEPEAPAEEPPEAVGKTVAEVQSEVEAINARVGSWVYVVPGYAGSNLRKRLDDLLKQEEAAPAGFDDELGLELDGLLPPDDAEPSAAPEPAQPAPDASQEGGADDEPQADAEPPAPAPAPAPAGQGGGGGG